jgi:signal transduction histidine kinase
MHRLVDHLLAYSKVEQGALRFERVCCDEIVDQVLESLGAALEQTGAKVDRGILPVVRGCPEQLSRLFLNLLDNALKYRGEEPPRIHVGSEVQGKNHLFCVRDNGMGFDPRYAEKVFERFHRLDPRGRAEGTGLGLATCRRIVELHGGRIWAEPRPGEGSTFFFTLPRVSVEPTP